MLKIYKLPNGRKYQFEEGKQPAGAVEVTKGKTDQPKEKKAEKTANKAKSVENKSK